jgi:C4-dicarboxylate-specific signal transduction histidine kinase
VSVWVNQVGMKRALANKTITEKSNTKDMVFYPVVRLSITLAYFHVVASNGRKLHSTSFNWSIDQLEYHCLFCLVFFSRLREISTSWSLSPLQYRSQRSTRVREGKQRTQDLNRSKHTHTSEEVSTRTRRREFTTQTMLKSQERWSDCVIAKSRWKGNRVKPFS